MCFFGGDVSSLLFVCPALNVVSDRVKHGWGVCGDGRWWAVVGGALSHMIYRTTLAMVDKATDLKAPR